MSVQKHNRELLLARHLYKWQRFELKGIAEISLNSVRLRKNISIIKKDDSLSLSIFDSGVFGLKASPLLVVVIDTKTSIELIEPFKSLLKEKDLVIEQYTIDDVNSLFNYLELNKETIISDKQLVKGQSQILFDNRMQIIALKQDGQLGEIIISLSYNDKETLDSITVSLKNETLLSIKVDSITYK
jgi:hypothetical protein